MSDEQQVDKDVQPEEVNDQASDSTGKESTDNESSSDDDKSSNNNDNTVVGELTTLDKEELIARIKQAQEKADENWDVALRTKAEMENVRRRTDKDIANARKFGIEKMINEIYPDQQRHSSPFPWNL